MAPPCRSTNRLTKDSPSPMPPGRAGDQRFEQPLADRRIDPGPAVGDGDFDLATDRTRLHRNLAGRAHRLQRVVQQVAQHLTQLRRVAFDLGELLQAIDLYAHPGRDGEAAAGTLIDRPQLHALAQ